MKERRNRSTIVLATKGGIDSRKPGVPVSLAQVDLDEDTRLSPEQMAYLLAE